MIFIHEAADGPKAELERTKKPATTQSVAAYGNLTQMFNLFAAVSSWFRKHFWAVIGVTLLSAAVSFGMNRFLGGRAAEVAGRVQFIFLVVYCFLMLNFYVFRSYQGRLGALLRSTPMHYFAIVIGTIILAFALLCIGITIHSILRGDI